MLHYSQSIKNNFYINKNENKEAQSVKEAFLHAWNNYKKYAYGKDYLRPLSKSGKDDMGFGLTIIDSMDTMLIMNLEKEYKEARKYIQDLKFDDKEKIVSASEMNARILGSFLSLYAMTNDDLYLDKAKQVGNILMYAWDDIHPLPYSNVNLKTKKGELRKYKNDSVVLAEAGSFTLEFCTLSYFTKDKKYCTKALNAVSSLLELSLDGIMGNEISFDNLEYRQKETLGEGGDVYYEYLLKMWLLTNKRVMKFRQSYNRVIDTALFRLISDTPRGCYTKEGFAYYMDHRAVMIPGLMALGSEGREKDLQVSKSILDSCTKLANMMKNKLLPASWFYTDWFISKDNYYYYLRPELAESLFYLNKITKDEKYRSSGSTLLKAINDVCKSNDGYHGIDNVDEGGKRDLQDYYFLSETLKYLYLLHSDDVPLESWVFNTAGHPLPVFEGNFEHLFESFKD